MNLYQLENAIRAKRMMSEEPSSKEPKVGDDVTYVNAKGQTKRAFVSKILTTKDAQGDPQIQLNANGADFAVDRKAIQSVEPLTRPNVGDDVTYVNAKGETKPATVSKILKTRDKDGDPQIQLSANGADFAVDLKAIQTGAPQAAEPQADSPQAAAPQADAPVKQTPAGKKANIQTDPALRGKGPAKGNFQSQDSLASGSAAVQAKKAEIAAKKAGGQAAPQAAAPQAAAPASGEPIAAAGSIVKTQSGQYFVKGNDGKWLPSDARGTIAQSGSAENPNSQMSQTLDQVASTVEPGKGGVITAPDNSLGAKIGRGIAKVKKAAADAIGGPLATQTRSDPNAGALKKAGATAGAGIGRAMAAVGGMKLPKGKAQAQAGAEPGAEPGAAQPAQLKPMPGPTASELKMLQKKTLAGDLASAKNLVNKLSDLKTGGYDADAFIQTAAPAMKRGGLAKSDPQAYAHFTKLARSMRKEAYQHLSNVLESAGFTWADVGYEVLVSESVNSHVMLIPIADIEMFEMKKLAGI